MVLTIQDPETWKPGEVREIPTVQGRSYSCVITRITPSFVEFIGPTEQGSVSRTFLRQVYEAGPREEFIPASPVKALCKKRRFNPDTKRSTGCTRKLGHTGHHSHNGRVKWDQ